MQVTLAPAAPKVAWWRVLSWQMYDFADTIYSMNVYTLYFGLFLTYRFATTNSFHVSVAQTVANVVVAVSAPLLGAMSDVSQRRLPFVRFFAIGTLITTMFIGFATSYWAVVALFTLSYFCYSSAWNFYQALLPGLCDETNVSKVSGIGVALGYVGSIFGVVSMMLLIQGKEQYYLVFPYSAVLFFLCAIPCMLWVPDFAPATQRLRLDVGAAYRRVSDTIAHARQYPGLFRFLVADFVYENAVTTVIGAMAIYSSKVAGFSDGDLQWFVIFSTVFAVAFGFIFGPVVDRIGPKRSVLIMLAIWVVVLPAVSLASRPLHLIILGPFAGIGLAATWISSRTFLVALAPVEKSGEFFGLYALSGKSANVLGQGVWSLVLFFLISRIGEPNSLRVAVWVMWVFIVIGLVMVWGLPDVRPSKENILDRSRAQA